jgi:two-component system sensor histidine kinase/response regulator
LLEDRRRIGPIKHCRIRSIVTPTSSFDPDALEAELRRARAQLAELEAATARAAQIKATFLADMSHDLRTPMNGVLGMAELLCDTPLTIDQRESVDVLTSSARTLLRVVDDMLDYSRIEAGTLAFEAAPFHLHRCIGDTLRLLAPAARAKGLDLVGYVDPALPECVTGDLTRLRQVVSNLTAHAIKVTAAGSVTVEIGRDGSGGHGARLVLHGAVRDTAPRMPADPGLGVTIAQRLVDMMGGRLWVESAPGQGSTFHFRLPVEAVPGELSLADARRARLTGARALVVHDFEPTRDAIARTLEGCGMAATVVRAADAVRQLRARDPRIDVVLLAATPATTDVAALLADVKAASPALPVLLIASPQDAARCSDLSVHSFLATPVPAPVLLAAVSAALISGDPPVARGRAPRRERFRDLRVLVAEDDPINQQVITLMLEGWGTTVRVAPSGREALAALDRERFDLVLMDVQMPDGDGFETTRTIRARDAGRPIRVAIVALTASREERARCLAAGMDDYLTKPVVPAELADVLERVVAADGSHA